MGDPQCCPHHQLRPEMSRPDMPEAGSTLARTGTEGPVGAPMAIPDRIRELPTRHAEDTCDPDKEKRAPARFIMSLLTI